ncbi:MAG: STAS domain-containing protein [Bacteroidetes bacterium]|nr:STAS domain-containing protein [Bacteroidota bacterium]
MNFEYTHDKVDDINLFVLKGELIDKGQALPFLYEVDKCIEKKDNKFILNLIDLKYMNSSGLNILINILTKSRKSGGDVAISGLSKKVHELLSITKLNSIFNIADSVTEAAEKLHS